MYTTWNKPFSWLILGPDKLPDKKTKIIIFHSLRNISCFMSFIPALLTMHFGAYISVFLLLQELALCDLTCLSNADGMITLLVLHFYHHVEFVFWRFRSFENCNFDLILVNHSSNQFTCTILVVTSGLCHHHKWSL